LRRAKNGYWYKKTVTGWRLLHHIIIEEARGRPINYATERVYLLKGKDLDDLIPDNIIVREKNKGSKERRRAQLLARRDEIDAELAGLGEV
jgi:hypothetical protein